MNQLSNAPFSPSKAARWLWRKSHLYLLDLLYQQVLWGCRHPHHPCKRKEEFNFADLSSCGGYNYWMDWTEIRISNGPSGCYIECDSAYFNGEFPIPFSLSSMDIQCHLDCGLTKGDRLCQYSYFTIQTLRISVSKEFKRALTSIQIAQFIVGLGFAHFYLFVSYKAPLPPGAPQVAGSFEANGQASNASTGMTTIPCLGNQGEGFPLVVASSYLLPLIYLFVEFYIHSYTPKAAKTTRAAEMKWEPWKPKETGTIVYPSSIPTSSYFKFYGWGERGGDSQVVRKEYREEIDVACGCSIDDIWSMWLGLHKNSPGRMYMSTLEFSAS